MSRRPRILIVDDSEVVIELTRAALEEAGFEVVSRTQSIGTGAVVVRERPDLLLLDIAMPTLDGPALVDMLRKNPSSSALPILLYSDRPVAELQSLVGATRADGYVSKSADTEPLIKKVRETLGKLTRTRDYALFVDDDEVLLRSLQRALGNSVNAEFTSSGFAALRTIMSSSPPRVVISDLVLGDLSGDHLLREAQKKDPSWSARFIFMSGSTSPMLSQLEREQVTVLAKPVSPASILETLEKLGMQLRDAKASVSRA